MITVDCCVCGEVLGTKAGKDGRSRGFFMPHLKEWMKEAKQDLRNETVSDRGISLIKKGSGRKRRFTLWLGWLGW